jgi:hypothetical protein
VATFRVTWVIDVEQDTPFNAALEAWETVRSDDSTACVFSVKSEDGTTETIDLADYLYSEDEEGEDAESE